MSRFNFFAWNSKRPYQFEYPRARLALVTAAHVTVPVIQRLRVPSAVEVTQALSQGAAQT